MLTGRFLGQRLRELAQFLLRSSIEDRRALGRGGGGRGRTGGGRGRTGAGLHEQPPLRRSVPEQRPG